MTRQAQENTASQAATYWTLKPMTELELPGEKIGAIAPNVPVPPEGYFRLQEIMRSGVRVSIPLSKGMVKNDNLLFGLSSDGMLLYAVAHIITLDDYNAPLELFIPGDAFTYTEKRTVHFAYNIQRGETLIMASKSVDVPVRA